MRSVEQVCVLGRLIRAARRKAPVASMEAIPEFSEDNLLCESAWPLAEAAEDWGMEYGDYGDEEENGSDSESEIFLDEINGDSIEDESNENWDTTSPDEDSTISEWIKSSIRTGMTVGFGLAVGMGWDLVKVSFISEAPKQRIQKYYS